MSLVHLLDDYLETIEFLPEDLNAALSAIHVKANEVSDLHRALTRHRATLLKQSPDGALLRKCQREDKRLRELIRDKLLLEEEVKRAVEKQAARLEAALKRSGCAGGVGRDVSVEDAEDVPWPDAVCFSCKQDGDGIAGCAVCSAFHHQTCKCSK